MTQGAYKHPKWADALRRKSSRSNGGTNGQCVQVAYLKGEFGFEDTKLGEASPTLELSEPDYLAILAAAHADRRRLPPNTQARSLPQGRAFAFPRAPATVSPSLECRVPDKTQSVRRSPCQKNSNPR